MSAFDLLSPDDSLGKEGSDHINISTDSRHHAGRILAPEYHFSLSIDLLGRFRSVYSLWVYLTRKNPPRGIKKWDSSRITEYLASDPKNRMKWSKVPHFRWLVAYVTWLKIQKLEKGRLSLVNIPRGTLLTRYRKIRISKDTQTLSTLQHGEWFIPICEELIQACRDRREPILETFSEAPKLGKTHYLQDIVEHIRGR